MTYLIRVYAVGWLLLVFCVLTLGSAFSAGLAVGGVNPLAFAERLDPTSLILVIGLVTIATLAASCGLQVAATLSQIEKHQ